MARQDIRALKRTWSAGYNSPVAQPRSLAQDAALSLLARSIGFQHERLAVIRLLMAVQAGASVPSEHWDYCERAAQRSDDGRLKDLWREAVSAGSPGR